MLKRKNRPRLSGRKGRHFIAPAGLLLAGIAMGCVSSQKATAASAAPYSPLWYTQSTTASSQPGNPSTSQAPGVVGIDLTKGLAPPVISEDKPVAAVPHIATTRQVRITAQWRQYISQLVQKAAQENHIEPALLHAVIRAESAYNPNAVSGKGAIGLMQVMPFTGRRFGVTDLNNPEENIKAGARYLSFLMKLFNNNRRLAVAAYNAGEQAVIRYGYRMPPFRETAAYVPRVLDYYHRYLSGALGSWF